MTKYYRYDYQPHEYDDAEGELFIRTFTTVKKTPKGAWVVEQPYGIKKRFILDNATKKYACPEIDQALTSLIARKKRQIGILTYQLRDAQHALELAERLQNSNGLSHQ